MDHTVPGAIELVKQGAEAKLYRTTFYGKDCMVKERFSKKYRHPALDKSLTLQRLKAEVRAVNKCRNLGNMLIFAL